MPIFDNYRVSVNPLLLHKKCWQHCKTIFPKMMMCILILYFMINAIPEIIGHLVPVSYVEVVSHFMAVDAEMKASLPQTPVVIYIYSVFLNGVLRLGEALFVLTVIRAKRAECGAIFEGFTVYSKAATLFILQMFVISFWSMLFVVPGIIAALNLSMSYFILADDPSKGVLQVMNESKMMMRGNRVYYLRLFITYSPLLILSAIPSALLSRTGIVDSSTIAGLVIFLVTDLILYAAMGYFTVTEGIMYELINSRGFENFRYAGQDVFRETEY